MLGPADPRMNANRNIHKIDMYTLVGFDRIIYRDLFNNQYNLISSNVPRKSDDIEF